MADAARARWLIRFFIAPERLPKVAWPSKDQNTGS